MPSDEGPTFSRLDAALTRALAPWRESPRELALLFSGGVDSSLLAWELRERPGLRLVTVGTPGSPDLTAAEASAEALGLRWSGAVVSEEQVRAMGGRIASESRDLGRVSQSVLTALAIALEQAGTEAVLCGQGVDELFLGYAHFRGLGPSEAEARSREDWRRLVEEDWPRTERIAALLGRTIAAPYLHPEFVAAARSVPLDQRLPGSEAKTYFRKWARHRGLPEELVRRPKRAMQYGSGIDRVLRSRG